MEKERKACILTAGYVNQCESDSLSFLTKWSFHDNFQSFDYDLRLLSACFVGWQFIIITGGLRQQCREALCFLKQHHDISGVPEPSKVGTKHV